MNNSTFNPFYKDINELEFDDLNLLIQNKVAEGWYIEYKSDLVDNKKFGNSIASFANSEGGWYFIGIKTNNSNEPEELSGIELDQDKNFKDQIRDIISGNVRPFPFYELKIINKDESRIIIVIRIEKGNDTPYMTNDGRIYVRNGEASEPVPEADRYRIQKLLDRKQEIINEIESFSINDFNIPIAQESVKQPFLEMYLYTYPFQSFYFDNFYHKDFFDNFCSQCSETIELFPNNINATTIFNNFNTSYESYIARKVSSKQYYSNLVLTFELLRNGSLKMYIPFPVISGEDNDKFLKLNDNSKTFSDFEVKIFDLGDNYIRMINGYEFILQYLHLLKIYKSILDKHDFKGSLKYRLRLVNIWKSVIFLDSKYYLDFISKNDIPLCLKREVTFPKFFNGRLNNLKFVEEGINGAFINIIGAMGIPWSVLSDCLLDLGDYIRKISNK